MSTKDSIFGLTGVPVGVNVSHVTTGVDGTETARGDNPGSCSPVSRIETNASSSGSGRFRRPETSGTSWKSSPGVSSCTKTDAGSDSSQHSFATRFRESFKETPHLAGAVASGLGSGVSKGDDVRTSMKVFFTTDISARVTALVLSHCVHIA